VIREAVRFGWPLMINSVLLIMVMNGEKVVVSREIGMGRSRSCRWASPSR
jgi:hypothetical protein